MRISLPASLRGLFSVAALAFACGSAFAEDYDYTFGADARAFAMGGAGLATTRNQPSNERRFNPASLAFTPKGFAIYSPSFSFRADGAISTTKAYSYLFNGAEIGETTDLIRRFGEEDSVFGFNANIGFRVGSFELLVQGVAKSRLLPNDSLANWARAGANLSNVPSDAQADVLAAGFLTLPSLAYAIKLPSRVNPEEPDKGYESAVGLRVRVLQTYYTRYFLNQTAVLGNIDPIRAPELGGRDYLKDTGVAADVGFLFRPRAGKGVSAALVVNNLVRPNASFRAVNAGLQQYQGRIDNNEEFDLLQTTVSGGAALETGGLTVAADLMDITSATRPVDLRFGAEQRVGKSIAIRGGYSSNTGVTGGFGLFGFNFAFGERLPLEINKSIRF
ncbi:MAG: conjugal transfer protein TraF [Akkermansiaceae bacterium]|nr:conjugal transfer protein TraF [Armatimonadota bacterium]